MRGRGFSGLPHLQLQMCVNGIPPKAGEGGPVEAGDSFRLFWQLKGRKSVDLLAVYLGGYTQTDDKMYTSLKLHVPNNCDY